MRRFEPNYLPSDLRDLASDINVQGARSKELLEFMKTLPNTDHRLVGLMDLHIHALCSYLAMNDLLVNELEKRFSDE